ncbi:MAG TPA: hypothetical protein VGH37_21230 [Candidatus Acidoferrum sp.]
MATANKSSYHALSPNPEVANHDPQAVFDEMTTPATSAETSPPTSNTLDREANQYRWSSNPPTRPLTFH